MSFSINTAKIPGNPDNCSLTEDIEAITHASEHIIFSQNIINKHSSSSERKEKFLSQLHSISNRAGNPILYLAVLGEFSSGKSTFINALLRQRLLKSARVATTASATYISYGDQLSIKATFLDNECIQATELNTLKLGQRISEIKANLPREISIKDFIDLLTSDQEVANHIKRIDILLPEARLKEGLSIIDTPGIGAGAEYTSNHSKVTKSVIDESADAAIVLIPSSQAMSDTLISFLRTTVSHFLHRCIFMITAMDDQEEEQRTQIIHFTKRKLQEKLGLIEPIVLESSAITMVPIPKVPSHKQDMWLYWQQQFVNAENVIISEMIRQRKIIISERLIFLIQSIFTELDKDIEETRRRLAEEEQYLNKNSIVAIEKILNQIFQQGIEKISRQGNFCKSNVLSKESKFRFKSKEKVKEIIDEAGWDIISSYSEIVEPKIRSAIEAEEKKFIQRVNEDIKKLKTCCEEVSFEFREQFEENYQSLKALGVDITVPSLRISSISLPSIRFTSPQYYIEQVNKEDSERTGWGAAIGAAAGFMLLGPIGAAIGAGLGGVTGYGSGNNLDTCRQGVQSRVDSDINNYVDKYTSEVKSTIDHFINQALSDLEDAVENHLLEYESVVNDMMNQHQDKVNSLSQKIQEAKSDSVELKQRKQRLETLQSKLIQV